MSTCISILMEKKFSATTGSEIDTLCIFSIFASNYFPLFAMAASPFTSLSGVPTGSLDTISSE